MSLFDKVTKYDFPLYGYVRLPEIAIDPADKAALGVPVDGSNLDYLKALAREGFFKKIKKVDYPVYGARVKTEFEVIEKLGFTDYYLLIWKICKISEKLKIARDYGRGSAAGSLIFSLIGVTDVDPIKHDLFFERFISEARAKKKVVDGVTYIDGGLAPDVDIDFDKYRKDEIVAFLDKEYPARVSRICTFNCLTGKLLLKECCKIILQYSEDEAKQISDMIPKTFGIVADIEEAYAGKLNEETGEVEIPVVEEFKRWADAHPEVYSIALGLRDIIRNKGTHPSGYIVSFDRLDESIPTELTDFKADEDEDDEDAEMSSAISSAFVMEDVANLAIKVDLLSARACSVISEVLIATGEKIEDINVDSDPLIYDSLQYLKTPIGLFQIEASTNLKVCRDVKPKNLSELSDVVAIARPGALSFLSKYVKNEHAAIHPLFDPILQKTRGVCLFQEQMMKLAAAVGFSLTEAETLRRIVGKKKVEEAEAWKIKIRDKVIENGLPVETGDLLWKILKDSAKYSFNASHALSFASLTALTVYLKFKYPQQYFLALLRNPKVKSKKIQEITAIEQELKFFGIKLLPPDLLKSDMDFKIEGNDIRFGLSSVKGISEKTVQSLKSFQTPHSNRFELFESAKNSGLNVGVLAALIQCGCLLSVAGNATRPSLTLQSQLWSFLTDKEKKNALVFGQQFDYNLFKVCDHMRRALDEKGKHLIKESRWDTICKKYEPKKAIYELNKKNLDIASFFYERMLIGYSYSTCLKDIFLPHYDGLMSVNEVMNACDDDTVCFMAVILDKPVERTSVAKNKYARFEVGDESGIITVMAFNQAKGFKNAPPRKMVDEIKNKHEGKLPQKDAIVYCVGKKKGDSVFLSQFAAQDDKIYTKFAQIKKETGQAEQSVE